MVAVTGLMTTDTFSGSKNIFTSKTESFSISTFREKSFVGNYVFDSLHLILAMIVYSHCRQQTDSEICIVHETQMSS
jgi:hypothetical protein